MEAPAEQFENLSKAARDLVRLGVWSLYRCHTEGQPVKYMLVAHNSPCCGTPGVSTQVYELDEHGTALELVPSLPHGWALTPMWLT